MLSSQIYIYIHQINQGDEKKKYSMERTCSTDGFHENTCKDSGLKRLRKRLFSRPVMRIVQVNVDPCTIRIISCR